MDKWVFFDLDGTLADSISVMYRVYMEFCRTKGVQGTKKEFQELNGPSLGEIIGILKKRYGFKESKSVLLASYEKKITKVYQNDVIPMAGAVQVLQELNRRGYKLLLTTSAKESFAAVFIKRQHWGKYFKGYVFGNQIKKGKPDSEIYELALRKSKANVRNVFVVEDSLNGVIAARKAGLTVLGFAKERSSSLALLSNGAGMVVSNLKDILKLSNDEKRSGYKIIATGNIKIKSVPNPVMQRRCFKNKDTVDKIWSLNVHSKKGKLFNGTIFTFVGFKESKDGVEVRGSFVEYKYFFAQNERPNLKLGIKPVGVSGLVVVEEQGQQYLIFARRARWTTQYPGFFELIPSGSIDNKSFVQGKCINHQSKLLSEFQEESGLPINCVKGLTDLAVILDTKLQVYDICSKFKINAGRNKISRSFLSQNEYESLKLLPLNMLNNFVKKYNHSIVPTSKALVHILIKGVYGY